MLNYLLSHITNWNNIQSSCNKGDIKREISINNVCALLWFLWYFHKYFNITVNVPLRWMYFNGLLVEYFASSKWYKNMKTFVFLKQSCNCDCLGTSEGCSSLQAYMLNCWPCRVKPWLKNLGIIILHYLSVWAAIWRLLQIWSWLFVSVWPWNIKWQCILLWSISDKIVS